MRRIAAAAVLVLVATACDGGDGDGADAATASPLRVVTTVAPITDLVTRVAGPEVEVVGLVPPGVDSHTYEPRPGDARTLADADLVVANGLFLEQPSLDLAAANVPDGTPVIRLAEQVVDEDEWVFDFSFPEEEGLPNPHLWTNPPMAREYARIAADALAELDPDDADGYRARYEALAAELDALDAAIATAWDTVAPEDRLLVTYHDSFPYFAPRYGITMVGAVQPSDLSEPSAGEVRALIEQIREHEVPAIFGSEVFPSDVLEVIAAETGAEYVDDLRDDELPGDPGDPEHSYVGMMVDNVRTLVTALGGDDRALDAVDPRLRTD